MLLNLLLVLVVHCDSEAHAEVLADKVSKKRSEFTEHFQSSARISSSRIENSEFSAICTNYNSRKCNLCGFII